MKRFCQFPVEIEMICRFRTAGQTQDIAAAGQRREAWTCSSAPTGCLGKDIRFQDLGLLVVDEEQRFGVAHKEKLKKLTSQVDVLTLSATPIPRTLNMALSGIRDMSALEEPPADRQPVQTYVLEHDWWRGGRRHSPGAGPGRSGVLPPQPDRDHRAHRRQASAPCWASRVQRRHRPRQNGPGASWETS